MFQGLRCLSDLSVKSGVKNELERGQRPGWRCSCSPGGTRKKRSHSNSPKMGWGWAQGSPGRTLGSAGAGQEDELSSALWGEKGWDQFWGEGRAELSLVGLSPWPGLGSWLREVLDVPGRALASFLCTCSGTHYEIHKNGIINELYKYKIVHDLDKNEIINDLDKMRL